MGAREQNKIKELKEMRRSTSRQGLRVTALDINPLRFAEKVGLEAEKTGRRDMRTPLERNFFKKIENARLAEGEAKIKLVRKAVIDGLIIVRPSGKALNMGHVAQLTGFIAPKAGVKRETIRGLIKDIVRKRREGNGASATAHVVKRD